MFYVSVLFLFLCCCVFLFMCVFLVNKYFGRTLPMLIMYNCYLQSNPLVCHSTYFPVHLFRFIL